MLFTLIDPNTWERKEYFDHYFSKVPCTYSMTTRLDITKIRKAGMKLYPTMLYALTKTVNHHREFRVALDEKGRLGYYDRLLPCYTVFHPDTETFSNLWTDYAEEYSAFCQAYEEDRRRFGSRQGMTAKPGMPANCFTVSMIPWTSFDGFHLNLQKGYDYLLPIFTMGKFYEEQGKCLLPLAIQVHHAVCDGFHVCRFVNELQDWLNG